MPLLNGEVGYRKEFATNTEYSFIYTGGQHLARVNGVIGGSGKKFYYHNDHLGSALAVTDEYGNKVVERDFTPFGERINTDVYDDVPRDIEEDESGFTGKDWDEDVELYYYNARWYDPGVGRFISEDSVADDPNLYGYCANNPINNIDPTGHFSVGVVNTSLAVFGAALNAVAILSKDEKLGAIASAFSLFVAVYNKYYEPKQAETIKDDVENNKPVENPVKQVETETVPSGGDTSTTNTGSQEATQPPPEENKSSAEDTQSTTSNRQLTTETLLYAPLSELLYLSTEASELEVLEAEIKYRNLDLRIKYGETFILPTQIKQVRNVWGKRVKVLCENGLWSTQNHAGWDLGNDINTEIISMASGVVNEKGWNNVRGWYVVIDHGSGIYSHYYHLNRFADINQGDFVGQGRIVGYIGKTGSATGYHLHFAISRGGMWSYVNPANYLTLPAGLDMAWDVRYNTKTGRYYNYIPPAQKPQNSAKKKRGWWF